MDVISRCQTAMWSEPIKIIIIVLSFFLSFFTLKSESIAQISSSEIYVVPVSGTVDPGMAAFIKRSLEAPSSDPDSLLILELDTFGGRVDSALQIVDTLLSVPKGRTIAYVKRKAISAGALIALASSKIVMRNNTTIGDCAPITYSSEGPKVLGEKFQSPLRAKFRALAKRNGYPETLAESMVTAEMVVYAVDMDGKILYIDSQAFEDLSPSEKEQIQSKKTIVREGELLTMDDAEALELGFSEMSVDNLDEMLQRMEIGNYTLIRIEENWSERLVRYIGLIAPLILLIGLASLYLEISAPGFGVPGIIGITCLALVFLNQYLVGLADYTELLLLILGIILLGFELFVIPGFGIAGIAGLIFIAAAAILAFQDFVIPDPSLPWQGEILIENIVYVLGALFMAIIIAVFFMRYIMPKLSVVVNGPYLNTTLKGSHADSTEVENAQVGHTGVTMTLLRPSGKVKIKDKIFDGITQGEFIERGTPVKISEIKGNRIIVSRIYEDE
ncbi:MAG: NfeD family protein [Desulfobacterales bacterium]|nr:NfeD family protein [Desulfobacterales bacterium]